MSTAVDRDRPMTFAGMPASSWAFAIRIWLANVLALYVSFWLELEAPSTAALTVALMALPTRGQDIDKRRLPSHRHCCGHRRFDLHRLFLYANRHPPYMRV